MLTKFTSAANSFDSKPAASSIIKFTKTGEECAVRLDPKLQDELGSLYNRITGQRLHFLKTSEMTGGEFLEMEASYGSFGDEPPLHYHPNQEEFFEVLDGELTVRFNNGIKVFGKGEFINIKPHQRHAMWNSGYAKTRINWKVYPALSTEDFLQSMWDLANEGKTEENGSPHLVEKVFLLKKHQDVFRTVFPGIIFIRFAYLMFSPFYFFKKKKK